MTVKTLDKPASSAIIRASIRFSVVSTWSGMDDVDEGLRMDVRISGDPMLMLRPLWGGDGRASLDVGLDAAGDLARFELRTDLARGLARVSLLVTVSGSLS